MQLHNLSKECVIFLLGKAYQKAHGIFKQQLEPFGITNMQHLILEVLWVENGLTAAELSKLLILDKATLSGGLDRMAEAGWIKKLKDKKDGRVIRLYTTEKADQIKDQLIEARKMSNELVLEKFSTEEKILLKRFLIDLLE